MRILALGGAGQEGSKTVKDLVDTPEVNSVIIGDLDIGAATRLQEALGSDKIACVQVDATDEAQLIPLMKDVDVTISFVGPYYRFGVPVLKTAIKAGCNYVDISDDYEPTVQMLELSEEAARAGITAITGAGVSPGTLNVAARDAMLKLDQVDEVHFRWAVPITDSEGEPGEWAALAHGFHCVDGDIDQYLDGQLTQVPAMSGVEKVDFPVLGDCEVFYLAHPEPGTVYRYIPGVKNVTVKGSVPGFDHILRGCRELGLTREEPIDVKGQQVCPADMAMALVREMPEPTEEEAALLPPAHSVFQTIALGKRDGKDVTLTYHLDGPVGPLTGIPASIIAQMLARGEISEKGSFSTEGCVNPDIFFEELAKRDIHVSISEQ